MNDKHSFPFPPELLAQTPPEVLAYFLDRLEKAEKRIAQLEEQLALTSQNSSKPPSSDPPSYVPPKKTPSKRKRGGLPGHKGHKRQLLSHDFVDTIIQVKPEHCRKCGHSFQLLQSQCPERHQVTELPVIKPIVTEYQLHHLTCPACKAANHAKKPKGVPEGMFGPRLMSILALCTGRYQITKRQIVALMKDFFSVDLALGTVSRIEKVVSRSLAPSVGEIERFVRTQSVVHIDETGMRQANQKGWLWAFVSKHVDFFKMADSRKSEVVQSILGEDFEGLAYTDRWNAYNWLSPEQRQFCWAHLHPDLERMKLRGGEDKALGERILRCRKKLFEHLRKARDGTYSKKKFEDKSKSLWAEIVCVLREGARCVETKKKERSCPCKELKRECLTQETARFCRTLYKNKKSLYSGLENLELTNNAAERAIRPAVLYRKRSFGVGGRSGSRFVERMMTVSGSLKKQGRELLDFVYNSVWAYLCCEAGPILIPHQETP